jgi:septum formation protein
MLVLASASPRRRDLLRDIGLVFRVEAVAVDETPPAGLAPRAVAEALAERKAEAVSAESGPVLAADTLVVAQDGEILGKPVDAADAARILRKLSGTTHAVVTGVCLRTADGRRTASAVTRVTMRALSFGKAGAYAIQEHGDRFVERVDGSWTNVVGLPVEVVADLLRAAGLEVPEAAG